MTIEQPAPEEAEEAPDTGGLPVAEDRAAEAPFGATVPVCARVELEVGKSGGITRDSPQMQKDIVFHFLSASTQIGMFDENSGSSILGNGSGVNIFNSKEFVLTAIYKAA